MKLLTLTPDGVGKLIKDMEKECRAIRKNCMMIGWYSRGSILYGDSMNLSSEELAIMNEIIEENLEVTKKSQLPFF